MLRFNLQPLFLRRWLHRHQHQNPKSNLKLRNELSQNHFAELQLGNQNQVSSSRAYRAQPEYRHRPGYPNLFDRLTPKR